MKFKKSNVKHNILFLLIVSSLLFLCGFMFLPEKNTYSETSWSDIVTEQDIFAFERLGNGTLESPFLISNAKQLATLSKLVYTNARFVKNNQAFYYSSSYFKLADNIDLSSYEWNPIGRTASYPFRGTFDGNGNVISGLKINSSSNVIFAGLFGRTNSAVIKNFSIIGYGSTINANSTRSQTYAGGIVAYAENTRLDNLTNLGIPVYSFSSDNAYAGGIVGYSSSCTLTSSCTLNNLSNYSNVLSYVKNNTANKEIYSYSGGIAGITYGASSRISYTRNNGKIKSYADGSTKITTFDPGTGIGSVQMPYLSAKPNTFSGGIVGQANTPISESFNSGEIISGDSTSFVLNSVSYSNELPNISYAGGIAGKSTNTITNTFNTGNVTANATTKTERQNEPIIGRRAIPDIKLDECSPPFASKELILSSSIRINEAEFDGENYDTSYSDYDYINAYAGGIVGYSESSITYSYNDGTISGGGIKCTQYISTFVGIYIGYYVWGLKNDVYYYKNYSSYFTFTYYDTLYTDAINGNLTSSANSSNYGSLGKVINFSYKNMKALTRYSDYSIKESDPQRAGDPERHPKYGMWNYNVTNLNSDTLTYYPVPSTLSDNFDGKGLKAYVRDLSFNYNIKRSGSNVRLDFYMKLSYDNSIAGYCSSAQIPIFESYNLTNRSINHTVVSNSTSITATNLGSIIWAKTSTVNSNRPYIKDFYW